MRQLVDLTFYPVYREYWPKEVGSFYGQVRLREDGSDTVKLWPKALPNPRCEAFAETLGLPLEGDFQLWHGPYLVAKGVVVPLEEELQRLREIERAARAFVSAPNEDSRYQARIDAALFNGEVDWADQLEDMKVGAERHVKLRELTACLK